MTGSGSDTDLGAGTLPRVALGRVRLVNGVLGLLVPHVLIRRIDPAEPPSPAAIYGLRLFGIRTILIGADLLRLPGRELDPGRRAAPLIHASPTPRRRRC